MQCNNTHKMLETEAYFGLVEVMNIGSPNAVHPPSMRGPYALRTIAKNLLLQPPSMRPPTESQLRAHGGRAEPQKPAVLAIGIVNRSSARAHTRDMGLQILRQVWSLEGFV